MNSQDPIFARLIEDPNYLASNEQERIAESENYEDAFRDYRQRKYNDVIVTCLDVMNNDQGNRYLAKYHLLKAMSIAGMKDRENFIAALREIIVKFPGTEEAVEAKRLLGLLADEKEIVETPKDEEKKEEKRKTPKGDYELKQGMDHYFAILVPNKGTSMSDLKSKMSDFNGEFYRSETFKVTNSFLNSESQILLVRTFSDSEKAMAYFKAFNTNDDLLSGVNNKGYEAFVITSKNFAILFKSKDVDGYMEFFEDNYTE